MSSKFNPVVDGDFEKMSTSSKEPVRARQSIAYFKNGCPEHQYEAEYRLQKGDTYVEAGAFWGRYGLIASRRVGPSGRVILIEGDPFNTKIVQTVMRYYELTNVQLVEGIVWSKTEPTSFRPGSNPAGGRKAIDSDPPSTVIEVQAYTLDDLLSKLEVDVVDLLSCDIEGAEAELVKGANKYLSEKKIRNVALAAYHRGILQKEIVEILINHGYRDVRYIPATIPQYGGLVLGHV